MGLREATALAAEVTSRKMQYRGPYRAYKQPPPRLQDTSYYFLVSWSLGGGCFFCRCSEAELGRKISCDQLIVVGTKRDGIGCNRALGIEIVGLNFFTHSNIFLS